MSCQINDQEEKSSKPHLQTELTESPGGKKNPLVQHLSLNENNVSAYSPRCAKAWRETGQDEHQEFWRVLSIISLIGPKNLCLEERLRLCPSLATNSPPNPLCIWAGNRSVSLSWWHHCWGGQRSRSHSRHMAAAQSRCLFALSWKEESSVH